MFFAETDDRSQGQRHCRERALWSIALPFATLLDYRFPGTATQNRGLSAPFCLWPRILFLGVNGKDSSHFLTISTVNSNKEFSR